MCTRCVNVDSLFFFFFFLLLNLCFTRWPVYACDRFFLFFDSFSFFFFFYTFISCLFSVLNLLLRLPLCLLGLLGLWRTTQLPSQLSLQLGRGGERELIRKWGRCSFREIDRLFDAQPIYYIHEYNDGMYDRIGGWERIGWSPWKGRARPNDQNSTNTRKKKPADRVFIHGKKTRATKTVFLNGWKKNVNVSPTRRMAKKKRKRRGGNIQKSKLLAIIISLV